MYFLPSRQRFKQARNQTLHLLDEQGQSYCQAENVARKKKNVWIEISNPCGRSVCKNCTIIKEDQEMTSQFQATIN